MASGAGAIRAGRAFVELFADDSKLVRGLRRASARLKAWGASVRAAGMKLAAVGAAVAAPLAASAKVFSSLGDNVDKMSARIGASAEFISALAHAAAIGGTNLETMEVGIRRLQRSTLDAERGLSTAVEAFDRLGVSVHDAKGQIKPTEQLFMDTAAALAKVKNNTEKAALATMIFGRSGTMLLPMLKGGQEGLIGLMEEAGRLGLVMSGADAAAAAEFTDDMARLTSILKMGVFRIGQALAPVLADVARWVQVNARTAQEWIKRNKGVIVTVLKVAAGVMALGAGLIVLGTIISGVGSMLSMFGTALGVVSSVLGFVLSPLGLVISAVVGLGAVILWATGAGGEALSWLGERFAVLKSDVLDTWGGIADALATGDIAGAAKILWLFLKMEWKRGTAALQSVWLGFRNWFVRLAYDAFYGAVVVARMVWHGLEVAWIETTAFLADAWYWFVGVFQRTWETMKAWAKKAWNYIKSLWDESVDVEAANRQVDEEKAAAIAAIKDETKRKRAAREFERQQARDAAARDHGAALSRIVKEHGAKTRALDAEKKEKERQSQAELDAARAEWDAARKTAAEKRKAKDAAGPESGLPPGLKDIDLGNLGAMADKITSRGTFSAAALWGMGAGPADRIALATEATAKNTKKLVDKAGQGMAFA